MITAAIIGVSGYSGAELLRLLVARSDVRVTAIMGAASAGKKIDEIYPMFSGLVDLMIEPANAARCADVDVVFLALPSGEAMRIVPELNSLPCRVIDLGGDFRLPSASLYKEFYQHDHLAPYLLGQAVYGLPELHRQAISSAKLIANPGCYPTSIILGLLPALKHNIIKPEGIVINSLSGVTGAGRTASLGLSFSEVNENIRAYKIGNHQHNPEIQTVLEQATGKYLSLSFIPHLVPMNRGIYTTIHADLNGPVKEEDVHELYASMYANEPFVRYKKQIPEIKDVLRTNFCDINIKIDQRTNKLIIISVIDNLLKGAAGQAVQNMNIMFHLPEELGLLEKEQSYVQ